MINDFKAISRIGFLRFDEINKSLFGLKKNQNLQKSHIPKPVSFPGLFLLLLTARLPSRGLSLVLILWACLGRTAVPRPGRCATAPRPRVGPAGGRPPGQERYTVPRADPRVLHPRVAARAAGPVELITDGRTGSLCDLEDAAGMARAITQLLGSATQRQHYSAAGQEAYAAGFARAQVVARYLQFFDKGKP